MQNYNYQLIVQTIAPTTCFTLYFDPNQTSLEYLAAQPSLQLAVSETPLSKMKGSSTRQRSRTNQMWSPQQDLEYFYFSIIFSMQNPYFTVSWEFWKPARFYMSMAAHMDQVFGADCGKSSRQCKTKDQNLKTRYYLKGVPRMDLLDLSLERLESWMLGRQMERERGRTMCPQTLCRYNRFEQIMIKYGRFERTMSQPKRYLKEFQSLLGYSASVRAEMLELGKLMNDVIDAQQSDRPRLSD